jgi:hypothetical protein
MMTRQHAAPSFSFKIRGARHGPLAAGINLRLPALESSDEVPSQLTYTPMPHPVPSVHLHVCLEFWLDRIIQPAWPVTKRPHMSMASMQRQEEASVCLEGPPMGLGV